MSIGDANRLDQGNRDRKQNWLVGILAVAAAVALVNWFLRSGPALLPVTPNAVIEMPTEVIESTIGMKLASIPAGEFMMGSSDSDDKGCDREKPQHHVRISRQFFIGVHEVTQGEWTSVMGTTPWKGQLYVKEGDRHPATNVNWKEATDFCRKLTEKECGMGLLRAGESYRLPTEAEWEYACRAGSTTGYYFGDGAGILAKYAWYARNTEAVDERYAHEVGRKGPNSWGLFDMHGNVWEWCSDQYTGPYGGAPVLTPNGPLHVDRGGCWRDHFSHCRSAYRFRRAPSHRSPYLGFRVVRSIAPGE